MASGRTVIVTCASQDIGAAIVQAFLERSYNVVATSRSTSKAGYGKEKIRFNAVAPGLGNLKARSPMGTVSESQDVADAVVYLTEAGHVIGEVLHVDDGAHVGRW